MCASNKLRVKHLKHLTGKWVNAAYKWQINQNQSVNQSVSQSINQSVNQSIIQSVNQ
jgi:hypothetical protein